MALDDLIGALAQVTNRQVALRDQQNQTAQALERIREEREFQQQLAEDEQFFRAGLQKQRTDAEKEIQKFVQGEISHREGQKLSEEKRQNNIRLEGIRADKQRFDEKERAERTRIKTKNTAEQWSALLQQYQNSLLEGDERTQKALLNALNVLSEEARRDPEIKFDVDPITLEPVEPEAEGDAAAAKDLAESLAKKSSSGSFSLKEFFAPAIKNITTEFDEAVQGLSTPSKATGSAIGAGLNTKGITGRKEATFVERFEAGETPASALNIKGFAGTVVDTIVDPLNLLGIAKAPRIAGLLKSGEKIVDVEKKIKGLLGPAKSALNEAVSQKLLPPASLQARSGQLQNLISAFVKELAERRKSINIDNVEDIVKEIKLLPAPTIQASAKQLQELVLDFIRQNTHGSISNLGAR
jgi:hypothetical protein